SILGFIPPTNSSQIETIQTVEVRFSKPMSPTSVTAATVRVRDASGNYLTPTNFELRGSDEIAELTFAPLLTGTYQIVVSGSVTDSAGNALGTSDVVSPFTLTPRAMVTVTNAPGNQVNEGTTLHGSVTVASGVAVQNVVVLANGQVVSTSS